MLLHDEVGFAPAVLADATGSVNFGTAGVFPGIRPARRSRTSRARAC